MDLEKARRQMVRHIDGQAKYQGRVVSVRFLKEDPGTEEQVFELSKEDKKAEVRLPKDDLDLRPHRYMFIDERIAGALAQLTGE